MLFVLFWIHGRGNDSMADDFLLFSVGGVIVTVCFEQKNCY